MCDSVGAHCIDAYTSPGLNHRDPLRIGGVYIIHGKKVGETETETLHHDERVPPDFQADLRPRTLARIQYKMCNYILKHAHPHFSTCIGGGASTERSADKRNPLSICTTKSGATAWYSKSRIMCTFCRFIVESDRRTDRRLIDDHRRSRRTPGSRIFIFL